MGVPIGVRSRVVPLVGEQSCASADFERADQGKDIIFLLESWSNDMQDMFSPGSGKYVVPSSVKESGA